MSNNVIKAGTYTYLEGVEKIKGNPDSAAGALLHGGSRAPGSESGPVKCDAQKVEKVDAWTMFEDRTLSLLARWRTFHAAHPERPDYECVNAALNEIDDDYARYLGSLFDPRD